MSKRYWRGPAVLPGTRVGPIPAENAVQNATGPAAPPPRRVLLVTGMSGAGKTTALKALEDVGFEAIDNLPLVLLRSLAGSAQEAGRALAIGIDVRTRDFGTEQVTAEIDALMDDLGLPIFIVFLDADDEVIERRYTETRRRPPLADDRAPIDGIRHERRRLAPLRDRAALPVHTTDLTVHHLRRPPQGRSAKRRGGK